MYPWQSDTRRVFEAYLESGRLPHALLLTGPPGCGKVELAGEFARELLCLEGGAGGCGHCRSCRQFAGGAHPDFREVTFEFRPRSEILRDVITVDQVRDLIETLYKTTTTSPRKVAIIHPAEYMNRNAANALLKTLEEPVGDTVLILVSHDAGRLPATIRSRCQRLLMDLPPRGQAVDWLVQSAGADPADAGEALAAAAGRPLQARALLENDGLERYRGAIQLLAALRQGAASDGMALSTMVDYEPADLWTWLSLRCSDLVRQLLRNDTPAPDVKPLTELQIQADRNRLLAMTPVRNDLLLRDWLIQWKNLPASLPLDRQTQEA